MTKAKERSLDEVDADLEAMRAKQAEEIASLYIERNVSALTFLADDINPKLTEMVEKLDKFLIGAPPVGFPETPPWYNAIAGMRASFNMHREQINQAVAPIAVPIP